MRKNGKKTLDKKAGQGNATAKKASAKNADAVNADVLPPETDQAVILRHKGDVGALDMLASSIKRDINTVSKLEKLSAMGSIKIGLALNAAKAIIRHGGYEGWVEKEFGDTFSKRKAGYFSKLARVFTVSEESKRLALPSPREAGSWLVATDEGSQLAESVSAFVGDMTFAELLDKHGVKAVKKNGGWKPPAYYIDKYSKEHAHLHGLEFDAWGVGDKETFKAWYAEEAEGDSDEGLRLTAEGTWHTLKERLLEHGLQRKSYALLSDSQKAEVHEVLAEVCKAMGKTLKK